MLDDFDRLEPLVAREHDGTPAPHARGQPQLGPGLPEAAVSVALPGSLDGQAMGGRPGACGGRPRRSADGPRPATGRHRRSGGGEP